MGHRTILRVALVQILVIVLGFITVGSVLKFSGYNMPGFGEFYRWNPLAVFLRHHTLPLLLIPAAWTAYALMTERRQRGFWNPLAAQVSALAIIALAVGVYSWSSLRPYTIPLVIGGPRTSAKVEPR